MTCHCPNLKKTKKMRKAKKPPIVIVDSREKKPWDFDDDPDFSKSICRKLDVGDYSIEGMEHIICIERKLSVDELYTNTFSKEHRERLRREMDRFQDVTHKFFLVEEDLCDVVNPKSYYVNKARKNKYSPKMPPAVVVRELVDFMLDYDIHVIFAGNQAKFLAKKLLLKAYNDYESHDKVTAQ